MTRMVFKAFLKKYFGADYQGMIRTPVICLPVFLGLSRADFRIQIAPFILYLTVTVFTGRAMWQDLSSEDHAADWQNMCMLPFDERTLVCSYGIVLGAYTFLTKTAVLLAVLLAVSDRSRAEVLGSIFCAVFAILMTSLLFFRRKGGYFLYAQEVKGRQTVKSHTHFLVWYYFGRYMKTHKNYLTNTAVMWCVACVLPLFFRAVEKVFVIPVGFAILSVNTPLGILLSCDSALEQAVRFLPGQKRRFLVPYALFIFFCNMTANSIFLCSWQIQMGGITGRMVAAAACFALLSAFFSVLLEWFCPIRGWETESDLWHHPRKYVVPAVMLLLAVGLAGF